MYQLTETFSFYSTKDFTRNEYIVSLWHEKFYNVKVSNVLNLKQLKLLLDSFYLFINHD